MIRMLGLVTLKPVGDRPVGASVPVMEEELPVHKMNNAAHDDKKSEKRAKLAQVLTKMKEDFNLSEEQLAKLNALIEELDPVGKEDADVDNDGDVDSSDKYLKNRRDAIQQNMKTEDVNEENPDNPNVVDDHEGQMAKSDLMSIHKKAGEVYNMLGDNEELEGWVQAKITKAAEYINSVHNNLAYEKTKPTSLGNGEGTPADRTAMNEKAPEGWEKTVKKMKKHKEIDNPFALAQYMKKKGYKPSK